MKILNPDKMNAWIEAMRLRTLPVSVAGVILATGFNTITSTFWWPMALLCLLFAILAQISSNFANEYYDFKAGLDRRGRQGPRRGVTEGDITPQAMRSATYATLAVACLIGLVIASLSGWWLVPVGVLIALAVVAYSAGPYPLSRHCLGEVAVLFFFGIIPVNLTYYVQAAQFDLSVLMASVSIGLMGANVLIVNNYRDCDDDRAVGKHTLAVRFGRKAVSTLYLINGFVAILLMSPVWMLFSPLCRIIPVAYIVLHTVLWFRLITTTGSRLNPLLGMTAVLMLLYSIAFALATLSL